jgi:2-dehydropantoate 2-reductase
MKTAIIGSGAMGSLYGGFLAKAGNDVVLYDINREHIDAVNSTGLVIEELATGEKITVRPRATDDPSQVAGADLFVVFVKSTATEAVARDFVAHASAETIVLTLQNGVGNEEIIRNAFGAHRSAAGVTSQGATFVGPGAIRHAGNGPTYLCMSDKNNKRIEPVVAMLNAAGFETHIDENIDNLIWSKLIINVGINALTALCGVQNGRLLDYPELKTLMADLVREGVEVAKAKGITLTQADPLAAVYEVAAKTGKNRSSMLQDFDRKSPSEIDFINNAIVREAEKLRIAVPVNRTVARLVKALDTIHVEEKRQKPAG